MVECIYVLCCFSCDVGKAYKTQRDLQDIQEVKKKTKFKDIFVSSECKNSYVYIYYIRSIGVGQINNTYYQFSYSFVHLNVLVNGRLMLLCSKIFYCSLNFKFLHSFAILVRGCRPGKSVQMTEAEVRGLCLKSREIFLQQSILLELEAPLKICGKFRFQSVFLRLLLYLLYDSMLLE